MVSDGIHQHYLPTGTLVLLHVELDDTSRMTRDCHVRICEGRRVRFPPATLRLNCERFGSAKLLSNVDRLARSGGEKFYGMGDVGLRFQGRLWKPSTVADAADGKREGTPVTEDLFYSSVFVIRQVLWIEDTQSRKALFRFTGSARCGEWTITNRVEEHLVELGCLVEHLGWGRCDFLPKAWLNCCAV